MNLRNTRASGDDAILSFEDPDAPIVAWNLDELDQSSDLDFLRSAWSRADEAG